MTSDMNTDTTLPPMDNEDFDALDEILDDLRTRGEDVPQWEFCEGAMAALLCTRRLVPPDEFFPLLLGTGDSQPGQPSDDAEDTYFKDAAQYEPLPGAVDPSLDGSGIRTGRCGGNAGRREQLPP